MESAIPPLTSTVKARAPGITPWRGVSPVYRSPVNAHVFTSLASAARKGEPVALGILTSIKGSSPQKAGALAVFHLDGRIDGSIGGGSLEAEVQKRAIASLDSGTAEPFEFVSVRDFPSGDAGSCGDRVNGWIFPNAQLAGVEFWESLAAPRAVQRWGITGAFEFVTGDRARSEADELLYHSVVMPPVALWLAGAGHVAQAVAPLAQDVGFQVHLFDDRPALVNHEIFPEETTLHCATWPALLQHMPAPPAFGVIMTRGHDHDDTVLRAWLRAGFGFLGMIGSRRKAQRTRESFVAEGLATEEEMAAVECPVGIDIAAQSPREIAVSVVGRLIERRANALLLSASKH